ncbi:MAG: hypothetical protein ACE37L_09380 [Allomuricauda sp.]|uniref:DUF7793 domain-containing protein n=1 Tax=Flagellimonas oceani TaxID=2698672 RepID=A0A6G7J8F9_9FLAO|nr:MULTISPECIES: hypothetical protein [Allomuricauda]MBW8241911.1 hypothetical protein [Allomuricauda oceani]QII46824.1 hypothetical protein GVT53_19780 [Allomuricauda oceani]
MKRTHENNYAIYLLTDELMHVIYKKVPLIDLKAAELIVQDRMHLQEGREMPVLCDIRDVRTINKAARDYLALEGSLWIKALAFLIDPPVTDDLSIFYMNTHPTKIPTASFVSKSEALAFLAKHTSKN